MYKHILILNILLNMLILISCNGIVDSPINDNYNITFDSIKQDTYLNKINKTEENTFITYSYKDDKTKTIVVYDFISGITNSKTVFKVFSDLNDFRNEMNIHQDSLDGVYDEVNEEILLIKTVYNNIDKISYQDLYDVITSNKDSVKYVV